MKFKLDRKFLYIFLFVLVTVVWGLGFSLVKLTLDHGTPTLLLIAGRFFFGAAALVVIRFFIKKNLKFRLPEMKDGFTMGLILLAAFLLQTYGLNYTTPEKSGMITGMYVVFVPIIGMVLAKKLHVKPIVDAIICLVGLLIFFEVFNQNSNINIGDALTLGGAFAFAVQMIIMEKQSPKLDTLDYTIFQLLTVGVFSLIGSLIFEFQSYSQIEWDYFFLGCSVLGLLSTGFAYYIQTLVQAKVSANTVSLVACLESVFSVVFSYFFGYAVITVFFAIGSALIFLSIVSSSVDRDFLLKKFKKPSKTD